MDIAILGDISKSMRRRQRKDLIKVVNHLIDKLGVSSAGNHFALGTFGSEATTVFYFKDPKYHNENALKDEVKKSINTRPKRFGTRTDLSMDKAPREMYTSEGGDRTDAKNIMLVITDGKPHIPRRDKKPFIPFPQSTEALEVIEFPFLNSTSVKHN